MYNIHNTLWICSYFLQPFIWTGSRRPKPQHSILIINKLVNTLTFVNDVLLDYEIT